MKVSCVLAISCCLASTVSAFGPRAFVTSAPRTGRVLFAEELSLEDEVELLVQQELGKSKRMSNLRNANGVEYAPWMNISPEDEKAIRSSMKEKAEARRKRQDQEKDVKGALLKDSQAQELSGVGIRSKVLDENTVELEWATDKERSTLGFVVKRRAAKTPEFTTLASYESFGPLATKGVDGGVYRFIDDTVSPGGWFYRITECESNGSENDLSQCLVEIQTAEEQRGTIIAAVAFGVLAIAAVVAGTLLDPVQ